MSTESHNRKKVEARQLLLFSDIRTTSSTDRKRSLTNNDIQAYVTAIKELVDERNLTTLIMLLEDLLNWTVIEDAQVKKILQNIYDIISGAENLIIENPEYWHEWVANQIYKQLEILEQGSM